MEIKGEKVKEVVRLYQVERLSMKQVSDKVNISPTTVQKYLIETKIKRRNQSDASYYYHQTAHKKPHFQIKTALDAQQKKLLSAAIMLYWAEGTKRGTNYVAFTNSDPEMIQIFLNFLTEVCGVEKRTVKFLLHCYTYHNEQKLVSFWRKKLGVTQEQFYKSYIHKGKEGTYKRKSKFGTMTIKYFDRHLLDQIMAWLKQEKNNLLPM
jgi:hypothetical protein